MTQITDHAELAAYLGAAHNTEESISRAVYKGTKCGAWATLEEQIPTGKYIAEDWEFDIVPVVEGFALIRARCVPDGEWVSPRRLATDVIESVQGGAFEDTDTWLITDPATVEFLRDNPTTPEDPYYHVKSVPVYDGTYSRGVSFGSIVEGVEMTTEAITIAYPCTEEDITKALNEIEAQAQEIWDQTHGCPECYDGKETVNIWEWASENGDDLGARVIDPNCTECKGQGVAI